MTIVLTTTFAPKAKAEGDLFNVSADHPLIKFCEIVPTYGLVLSQIPMPSFWPSIQVLPFPPFIAPGILFGLSQRTSVITTVCQVLSQIEKYNSQSAIENSRDILNTLTDNKFEKHLTMVDKTYNLANSIYNFEDGTYRKGSLESAQTHRDLNDYMAESYSWYHSTFNGKEAKLKNRDERERDMNELAQLAYQRAVLEEAGNCPAPDTSTNYDKVYSSEIRPWETKRAAAKDDMEFFKSKLLSMGPRFLNDEKEFNDFAKDLEKLQVRGVDYQVTYKNKQETKTVPHKTRKMKDGKPKMVQEVFTTKTQEFTARVFADDFNKFKNKHNDNWSSWVTAQFLSRGTEGLLNDPRGKVEDEFRDLAYECQEAKLMRGFDDNRSDYQKVRDERFEKCKTDTRMNQKKAENLFNYYITQYQNSIYLYKQANANIWTKESWHLGTMRSVNSKDTTEGFQQETVTCAEGNALTSAEISKLEIKSKQVNQGLQEFVTKQYQKKTIMMEEKKKAESEHNKENQQRKAYAQKQNKKQVRDLKQQVIPVSPSGSL